MLNFEVGRKGEPVKSQRSNRRTRKGRTLEEWLGGIVTPKKQKVIRGSIGCAIARQEGRCWKINPGRRIHTPHEVRKKKNQKEGGHQGVQRDITTTKDTLD